MGTIVNAVTIVIAGAIGLFLNTGIPERMTQTIMAGIALSVVVLGLDGALSGGNITLMIVSIALGSFIGELLDLDGRLNRGAESLEKRFLKNGEDNSFSEGFINATLVVCVGSMAILGSLESGLLGDNTTLYIKSLLDGIFTLLLASSMGVGVLFSSVPLLIYQGSITLFAGFLQPFLSPDVVAEVVAVGSVLLIALGFNMLELTSIRVMNMLPAMAIPVIIMAFI